MLPMIREPLSVGDGLRRTSAAATSKETIKLTML